jgi:hypothetical protein
MKNHWVKGIVIGYVLFMSGILYIVVISQQYSSELVSDDYYEKGQNYQKVLDAKYRVSALSALPKINSKNGDVLFSTPYPNGVLKFFCPSEKSSDFSVTIVKSKHEIPVHSFSKGFYQVEYHWEMGNKTYLWEEDLYLK